MVLYRFRFQGTDAEVIRTYTKIRRCTIENDVMESADELSLFSAKEMPQNSQLREIIIRHCATPKYYM